MVERKESGVRQMLLAVPLWGFGGNSRHACSSNRTEGQAQFSLTVRYTEALLVGNCDKEFKEILG